MNPDIGGNFNFASNRYRRVEPIGAGAYGTVYKAIDSQTQQHVALKKIKIESEEEGIPSTAVREMCILHHLSHENIVQLKDVIMDELQVILVFELEDMDLKKYLDNTPDLLPLDLVQSYSAQIICGLKYLHSMGVMHRDLKPQNILLSKEGVLKLADFGLSRAFTAYVRPLTPEHVITIWYRAPEVLLGASCYNASVDMWSAACVIAEMSSKKPLFGGSGEFDQLLRIFKYLGTPQVDAWPDIVNLPYWRNNFPDFFPYKWSYFLPNLDEEGRDLISKILVFDPNGRLPARDALNHPFVRQYVVRTPISQSPRERMFESPSFSNMSSPRTNFGKAFPVAGESLENFQQPSNLARIVKRSNSMPNPNTNSNLSMSNSVGNSNFVTVVPGKVPTASSRLVIQPPDLASEMNSHAAGNSSASNGCKVLIGTNKSSFSALPKNPVQTSLGRYGFGNSNLTKNENINAFSNNTNKRRSIGSDLDHRENGTITLDDSIEISESNLCHGDGDITDNSDSNLSSSNPGRANDEDNINANISAAITNINRKQQVLKGGDKALGRARTRRTLSTLNNYRVPDASPDTTSSGLTSSASSSLTSSTASERANATYCSADDSRDEDSIDFGGGNVISDINSGTTTSSSNKLNNNNISNNNIINNSINNSKNDSQNKSAQYNSEVLSKRKSQTNAVDNLSVKKHAGDISDAAAKASHANESKVYNETNFMKDAKLMAQMTAGVGRLTRRQSSTAGFK